jgi:phosphopantothenoylcysteine synthetase/decarboxylase
VPREDITIERVVTACEKRDAVMEHHRDCTVVIKAAAVADFSAGTRIARRSRRRAIRT